MPYDLLLNDDFTIKIDNGDFVVGEATRQHQTLLLKAQKGELRDRPELGIGIEDWLNDDFTGNIAATIQQQFAADGMVQVQKKVNGVNQIDFIYPS